MFSLNKYSIAILFFFFTINMFAQTLDIYVMNPEVDKGDEGLLKIIDGNNKQNNKSVIIDGRTGEIVFRGLSSELEEEIEDFYGGKQEIIHDTAYTFRSIYGLVSPGQYERVNLYLINSIFYKNINHSFSKGTPNDSFIISNQSGFYYLQNFNEIPIYTYIINHKKLFIKNNHKNGLKRFYTLLCDKKKLNLQTFNTNFSTTKEQLQSYEINPKISSLKIEIKPPKKIRFNKDELRIQQDKTRGTISGFIYNLDRKNDTMVMTLNGVDNTVKCNLLGKCKFTLDLDVGNNIFSYKQMDNKVIIKNFESKYIPLDIINYYIVTDPTTKGEIFVLNTKKVFRPEGSEVEIQYVEEDKKLIEMVNDKYYEFKIPLKYGMNTFILKQYNGGIITIPVESKKIKMEEVANKNKELALTMNKISSIENNSDFKGQHGDPRINLKWNNKNDLDLSIKDACGQHIQTGTTNKQKSCNGFMGIHDLDANYIKRSNQPQENIVWKDGASSGTYKVVITHYWKDEDRVSETTDIILTIVNNGETFEKKATVTKGKPYEFSFVH